MLTAAKASNLVILVACCLKRAASEVGREDFCEAGKGGVEGVIT
jgi:hypothetical protein